MLVLTSVRGFVEKKFLLKIYKVGWLRNVESIKIANTLFNVKLLNSVAIGIMQAKSARSIGI